MFVDILENTRYNKSKKNAAREREGVTTSRLDLWKSRWGFFYLLQIVFSEK